MHLTSKHVVPSHFSVAVRLSMLMIQYCCEWQSWAVDMSRTAGDNEQRERPADDEGSDEECEGGKGDGDGDEGGGRSTATRVKKRVRVARATAT